MSNTILPKEKASEFFTEMKPFIERVDGEILNEYLCKYYGSDHGDFVSALLDLVINEKNSKLQHQLEIQAKRVENLKKSNEFYAEELNWQDKTYSYNGVDDPFMDSIKEDTNYSENYICSGGKLARSCQAIDQELEKELEGVK